MKRTEECYECYREGQQLRTSKRVLGGVGGRRTEKQAKVKGVGTGKLKFREEKAARTNVLGNQTGYSCFSCEKSHI